MKKILNAAGKRFEDLPTLPGMVDAAGKNTSCYNFLCGNCPMTKGCAFIHVEKNNINDQWATNFCQVIQPGVDYVVRNEEAAPGGGKGSPSKKIKKEK